MFSLTPYDFNLNISPRCQTLSKTFEISKNTPLPSIPGLQSKDKFISCTIDSTWEIQKSPGKKPDWKFVKSSFVIKWWNKSLKISGSDIFSKTGRKLTLMIFQYIFAFFFINKNYIGFLSLVKTLEMRLEKISFNGWDTDLSQILIILILTMRFIGIKSFDDLAIIIFTK